MLRAPKTFQLLLALAITFSMATGTVATAAPAHAVAPAAVVATADNEVGTTEGSARADSYGAAVDLYQSTSTYAWCAAFVSWVMERTGASGFRSASVGEWIAVAAAHDYGLSITKRPRPGDLVAFDWDGNGDFAYPNRHIGVVASAPSGSHFRSIEGNTDLPSGGQGVAERVRSTTDGYSTLFIRIHVHSGTASRHGSITSDPAR
jgi:hypothetical protein